MSIILKFNKVKVDTLIDTGSERTLLRRDKFLEICKCMDRQPLVKPGVALYSITGQYLTVYGETELYEENGGAMAVTVVDEISHEAILGADALGREAMLDFSAMELLWRNNVYPMHKEGTIGVIGTLGMVPPIMGRSLNNTMCKAK